MIRRKYPHTTQGVGDAIRAHGGSVHGNDSEGWTDGEWTSIIDASPFLTLAQARGWPTQLARPIASLTRTVVIHVWAPDKITAKDLAGLSSW